MQPIKYFLLIFFLLSVNNIYSQKSSLTDLSYEEIEKRIDNFHNNPHKMWDMINIYIKKSKKEKNFETLLYAYRYASNFSDPPVNLKYADSALTVSKYSKSTKLLANAYLNRGIVFINDSQYQKALDDILIANKYLKEFGDPYIINKTIYLVAQNKIYLGLYEDANKELEKCINFFKNSLDDSSPLGKDYQTYYIFSLISYIDSNTRIGRQNQNKILIKEGINYLNKNNLKQYIPYFISSEGTDAYYSKDYRTAISKLTQALEMYNDQWTHITEIYYLGLTYWKTGKRGLAVKYLEEIDNEYNKTNKLDPQFRSAYEVLIKYNDSISNRDKQLEYINKLMVLDNSYERNFKYLYPKINKEYDTKKLIEEKALIESSLKRQKQALIFAIFICIGALGYFISRYYRLKKIYKKRFEEILYTDYETKKHLQNPNKIILPQSTEHGYYHKVAGLNPIFVENILKQLALFEEDNKFLNPQISQKALSEEFGTNSTYFSKIINAYKGTNFSFYINDLRLNYIVNQIKNDYKYLNMDIKELARIAGFTNTESFSDNFQRKYKIKPSYFIKMMKENTKTFSL